MPRKKISASTNAMYFTHRSAFGSRNPFDAGAFFFDAHIVEHAEKKRHSSSRVIITRYVVAITGVTAAKYNAVGSLLKRLQNEHRVYAARARHADYFYVCRIRKSARSGKVGAGIRTPVAAKRNYVRHELFIFMQVFGFYFVYALHIASTSDII